MRERARLFVSLAHAQTLPHTSIRYTSFRLPMPDAYLHTNKKTTWPCYPFEGRHPLLAAGLFRSRDLRVCQDYVEDGSREFPSVRHLMFERVVEEESLALGPLACLASDDEMRRAALRDAEPHVHIPALVCRPTMRTDHGAGKYCRHPRAFYSDYARLLHLA